MTERMARIKVGDALVAGTDIGPVSSQAQLAHDLDYVAIAKAEGAVLAAGGERLRSGTEGYFMSPALFSESTPDMRISREEVFGPVANILRAKNYEEALALANDTEFGLSAGIATTSLKHATHFKRHSQAGMVMVNLPTAGVDWTGSVRCARRRSRSRRRNTARFSPRCSTSAICWI
jgi:aldehyde dehydrogenase (NAD+)